MFKDIHISRLIKREVKNMEEIINKKISSFSKITDIVQTILIFLIALLVPTFLGELITNVFGSQSVIAKNSQIIIGSIVNTALIMTAINLNGWAKILGVVTMPSISTILSGYVFGSASTYMVYMIPAIWIGNFILVYLYKLLLLDKKLNYFLAGIAGVLLKVAVIFLFFNVLNLFNLFPEKLVSTLQNAMGITQLITASIGVVVAFVIYKAEKVSKKI